MIDLRNIFACRLCWRIALTVFGMILAVECVILLPSASRFERAEFDRLADNAVIAVEPLLAAALAASDPQRLSQQLQTLPMRHGLIRGVAVYSDDRTLLGAAGEPLAFPANAGRLGRMTRAQQRSADRRTLEVEWRSGAAGSPLVAARIDSGNVRGQVIDYALRIAGLVAIIVLVVTAGTMLVLHRLVLRPVFRIRASAIAAAADPDAAHRHKVSRSSDRDDEIGELMAAHDALLGRVADSKARDRELAEERAHHISSHDALTGLPNRNAFLQQLELLRSAPGEAPGIVSIYLVNLLQFRLLNTTYGTARCDELLRRLAVRLQTATLPADFVAHFGADRFAIAHFGDATDAAKPEDFAERLLADVCDGYDIGGASVVSLDVRIGIASAAANRLDGHELVNEAELALARTRGDDGARYEFYSPELAENARERQAMLRDLESAIANDELFAVLQPRMALQPDGAPRLAGAELLLRWNHPERGPVSPGVFIPLAEATGLIVPIGEFALRAACACMRRWLDRHGWSPRIAVNLSARQFALPDLRERLEAALQAQRLPAGLLEVEVTETAAMRDVAKTAATLAGLRSLGVHVSIDDFGTGYSSLNYLRRFAIDAIKIDKSFVDDIGADRNAEAICDAILRLGQALGITVVAEGVETEAQLEFLARRKCDEAQGYLFSRPIPIQEFESNYLGARAGSPIARSGWFAAGAAAANEDGDAPLPAQNDDSALASGLVEPLAHR